MKIAALSTIIFVFFAHSTQGFAQSIQCDDERVQEIRAGYDVGQVLMKYHHDLLGELITEIVANSKAPKAYVMLGQDNLPKSETISAEVSEIVNLLKKKRLALSRCVELVR